MECNPDTSCIVYRRQLTIAGHGQDRRTPQVTTPASLLGLKSYSYFRETHLVSTGYLSLLNLTGYPRGEGGLRTKS